MSSKVLKFGFLVILSFLFFGNELHAQTYSFTRPSRTTLLTALNAKNPNHEHPRLYVRSADFVTLRQNIQTDPQLIKWFAAIKAKADRTVDIDTVAYKADITRPRTPITRAIPVRIYPLVLAYQVTLDKKYADRAIKEMLAISAWSSWPPAISFIDTGDILWGFAVGYDWCYDVLTPAQRTIIRNAIIAKGLNPLVDAYNSNPNYNFSPSQGTIFGSNNWNPWINGSASACAMAIGDEEPAISGEVLERALVVAENFAVTYGPDGASVEGPGYGNGAMDFYIQWIACMESALGTSYNYFDVPGVPEYVYFSPYMNGPVKMLNFHDSGTDKLAYLGSTFFFANKLLKPGLGTMHKNDIGNGNGSFFDIFWYRPDYYANSTETLPLDKYFKGLVQSGSMRSSFTDPNSNALLFHGGENDVSHTHLDIGQFNIDAMGLNWALDLGTEDATYKPANAGLYPRYSYYRLNPGGHNTLLIDPSTSTTYFGQSIPAYNPITKFVSASTGAFALMDITQAYKTQVNSAIRGYALTANRSRFIIQDEVDLIKPSVLWWNMNTCATIQVSADGRTAILSQVGKKMRARLISPAGASFQALKAEPLPESYQIPIQSINTNIQKLAIKLSGVKNVTIMVEFTPINSDADLTSASLPLIPLSNWAEPRPTANLFPTISYDGGPYVFALNKAILDLAPTNTGGSIPITTYGTVSTVVSSAGGQPHGMAFNSDYSLMYTGLKNVFKVGKVDISSGTSVAFAGSGTTGSADGTGAAASFATPYGTAVNPITGDIYVADQTNNTIRKITIAGVVTKYAGITGNASTVNGDIASATFNSPIGLAFDADANLYVLQGGGSIRKIDATGTTVSTLITGIGTNTYHFAYSNGYFYVSDVVQNKIFKISLDGTSKTVLAGSGTAGSTDGVGTSATLNGPRGVAVDMTGNVYVADYNTNKIRMITSAGVVTTIAGSGTNATTDAVGTAAAFRSPAGLVPDASGNLYVGDAGANNIRKIVLTGYTISPALPSGLSFDGTTGTISGIPTVARQATAYTVAARNTGGESITTLTISTAKTIPPVISYPRNVFPLSLNNAIDTIEVVNTGGAVPATIYGTVSSIIGTSGQPYGLTVNPANTNILYIANRNNIIQKLTLAPSALTTLAGTSPTSGFADGTGTAALFNGPHSVAVHPTTGNIYVADQANYRIRRITTAGMVTTFAGTGASGSIDGAIASATFSSPTDLTFDNMGVLYVLQTNGIIRKISSDGTTVSTAATSIPGTPYYFTYSNGYFYVSGVTGNQIGKVSLADGSFAVLAGAGTTGTSNGAGPSAQFNGPRGMAVDSTGNVYVADYGNNLIRRITPTGEVTTLAGSGAASEINGVGTSAAFNIPNSLVLDGLGNLYVGVAGASTIRKVLLTGYSITPALPAGLVFNKTTGSISGTPTAISTLIDYTITAYNANGSYYTDINISVSDTSASLPVKLIQFDVTATGNGATKVTWVSNSELNNNYFSVERSENGRDFTELGKIPAGSNPSDKQFYSFTDSAPIVGVSYYRLSQTDMDGKTEILGLKPFKNTLNQAYLTLYPNPIIGGSFSVNFSEATKAPFVVELLSLDGKIIYQQNLIEINKSVYNFQLKNLPAPGTYILKVGNVLKKIICL